MIKKSQINAEILAELDALQYVEPDLSDNDEFDDGNWQGAVRGMFKFSQRHIIAQELAHHLEDEVLEILKQHNTHQDFKRINHMIKSMYATA